MNQPTKISPIHHIAVRQQAQLSQQHGWQVVLQYRDVAEETAAAQTAVLLIDQTPNGKIRIEGQTAGQLLQADDLDINRGKQVDAGTLYRLRTDLFFRHTTPAAVGEVTTALTQQAATVTDLITITNVTHGNAELWLIGPHSAELLSRLCGLDFHGSQFANYSAKQSSVAKTTQLILRRDVGDLPTYALIGPRSLGAYLWETILEAGQNLGIQTGGTAVLDQLN